MFRVSASCAQMLATKRLQRELQTLQKECPPLLRVRAAAAPPQDLWHVSIASPTLVLTRCRQSLLRPTSFISISYWRVRRAACMRGASTVSAS